jgi:hypothetical protein
MILGAEVALLVLGLYALIAGKMLSSKKAKYDVRGWRARVVGLVCLLPLPLSLLAVSVVGVLLAAQGKQVTRESSLWLGAAVEGSTVLACAIAAGLLDGFFGRRWSNRRRMTRASRARAGSSEAAFCSITA